MPDDRAEVHRLRPNAGELDLRALNPLLPRFWTMAKGILWFLQVPPGRDSYDYSSNWWGIFRYFFAVLSSSNCSHNPQLTLDLDADEEGSIHHSQVCATPLIREHCEYCFWKNTQEKHSSYDLTFCYRISEYRFVCPILHHPSVSSPFFIIMNILQVK